MDDNEGYGLYCMFELPIRDPRNEARNTTLKVLHQEYGAKTPQQRFEIASAIKAVRDAEILTGQRWQEFIVRAKNTRLEEQLADDDPQPPVVSDLKSCRRAVEIYRDQLRVSVYCNRMLLDVLTRQQAPVGDLVHVRLDIISMKGGITETLEIRRNINEALAMISRSNATEYKLPDSGFHAADARRNEKDNFIDEPLGEGVFGADWKYARDLGGGISRAGLWVKVDNNGRVIDRLVKKSEYCDEFQWMAVGKWHGSPADIDNRVPLEFWLQDKCAQASPNHFVRLRCWSQDHSRLIVSLYVEWCAHGDLYGVNHLYKRHRPVQPMPEPALWMIFLRLVEACLILRQGSVTSDGAKPGWKEIVHRDIKDQNISLDLAHPRIYPSYPMPKLADFGLAFETHIDDPLNPRFYNRGVGTKPFLAPEQSRYRSSTTHKPKDDWKLLAHTNVYAIGATMWDIVSRNELRGKDQPTFTDPEFRWEFSEWTKAHYSERFLSAVDACVNWDPAHRPTLERLRDNLDGYIRDSTSEQMQYMRSAQMGYQPENARWSLFFPTDGYKLDFAALNHESSSDADGVGYQPPPPPPHNPEPKQPSKASPVTRIGRMGLT